MKALQLQKNIILSESEGYDEWIADRLDELVAQYPVQAAIVDHVARESVARWGADLVAIVLLGSFARGDTHQYSDVDLLLVVNHLPQDWRERGALELSFERLGLRWGKPLQVILVEPEEVRWAVDTIMPLLLEIREGYRRLVDRGGFFEKEMKRLESILLMHRARKLAKHEWEVPELAGS